MNERPTTPASRLASVATWAMAAVLGTLALLTGSPGESVLIGATAVVAALGATRMWFHNCFESRLVVVVSAGIAFVPTALHVSVGLPGTPPAATGPTHVSLLLLPALVALLLVADVRTRQREQAPGRTYAP